LGSKFAQRQDRARTAAASARQSRKKVNRAKRKAQQQRADVAGEIVPTGFTPLLCPSPEDPSPEASAGAVAGSDEDVVTASHAPVRTDEESEGPSHLPKSALVAASTGKRQDADVASDSSDSIVAPPSDSMACHT